MADDAARQADDHRCTCATDGNAARCPLHTQADFDAQRAPETNEQENSDGLLPIEVEVAAFLWDKWADDVHPAVHILADPRTVARHLRPYLRRSQPAPRTVTAEQVEAAEAAAIEVFEDDASEGLSPFGLGVKTAHAILAALGITVTEEADRG